MILNDAAELDAAEDAFQEPVVWKMNRRVGAEELCVVGDVVVGATVGVAVVVGILIDVVVLRTAVHDLAPAILPVQGEAVTEAVSDLQREEHASWRDVVGVVGEGVDGWIEVRIVDPVEVVLPCVVAGETAPGIRAQRPNAGVRAYSPPSDNL